MEIIHKSEARQIIFSYIDDKLDGENMLLDTLHHTHAGWMATLINRLTKEVEGVLWLEESSREIKWTEM